MDNLPPQQANVVMPPSRSRFPLIIIIVVIFLLLLGGLFLGTFLKVLAPSSTQQPAQSTVQQPSLPKGYQKASELSSQFKPFLVGQGNINFQLKGTLEAATEKSWTMTNAGQRITVVSEVQQLPNYLRRATKSGQSMEKINSSQISPGTEVTLSVTIDPATGSLAVLNVTID